MKFPLHQKTLDLLRGLEGIEIGAAAHNPFGVNAKNIAPKSNYEYYAKEQQEIAGEVASIDIDGLADDIPLPDSSVDFVLSSHVVEHLPDLIAAFKEWDRVTRPGGYIVIIAPLRDALKSDAQRELSTFKDIVDGMGRLAGGPKSDKHYWVFTIETLKAIIDACKLNWTLIGEENPDSKVRNGFWLAYKTRGTLKAELLPSQPAPITIVIPTLSYEKGLECGKRAVATAGCEVDLIVVAGEPRGFTKTVNEGIRQVPAGDVCILNDDITTFQEGWLRQLQGTLHSSDNIGIVGPGGKSGTDPARHGRPGMVGTEECEQISYWCVVLKRLMLEQIGLLDERFVHYCSDNDYNNRARKAGWKVVWDRSVYLKHEHHGSGVREDWLKLDQRTYGKPK